MSKFKNAIKARCKLLNITDKDVIKALIKAEKKKRARKRKSLSIVTAHPYINCSE